MRWSKLKKEIEERFAPAVQGKIHLHLTRYSASALGRGWITYRGKQLVNFETHLSLARFGGYYHAVTGDIGLLHTSVGEGVARTPNLLIERGEFSHFDFRYACRAMLRLAFDEALASPHPLIQGLAFLDKRLGKRRLSTYAEGELHPFAKKLLDIRRAEESQARNTITRGEWDDYP